MIDNKKKYLVMNRDDGTGSRIFSLMNVLFLAEKLGDINYAKFLWSDQFARGEFYKGETTDTSIHNTNFRNYKNQSIIGASCENKEAIFSEDFISKFYIENLNEGEIYHKISHFLVRDFKELKKDFESNLYNFFTIEIADSDSLLKIDSQEYRQGLAKAFKNIGFNPHIQNIISKTHQISKDLEDYNVIHLRASDNVGFWTSFRKINERQVVRHGTYFELALALIEQEPEDKKFIIVSDDLTSANELVKIINRKNVFCVDKLRDSSTMSNLELFFFDIIFMSNSKVLYGTHSALVRTARGINPNLICKNSYEVFTKEKQYEILTLNYPRLKNLYPALRAFSCAHKFYLARELNLDIDTQISHCDEALSFDSENDKYRIYKIDCLLKKDTSLAESYIKEVLTLRAEVFLELLLSRHCWWYWDWDYVEFFDIFLQNASASYPYLSYLAAKITRCKGEVLESILHINDVLQANDSFLNELLKPDLEFKEQDIKQLVLGIQNNLQQILPKKSVKTRIHNHLAYKLGSAMIDNSKSFLGYIRMIYVLSYIKDKHLQEQKLYKEKIKIYPNLALPPLENYDDYKEALKEKECFTYQLGLSFMKAHKSWYKGGYLRFFFKELPRLKRLKRELRAKKMFKN